jgi:hypothetical protein
MGFFRRRDETLNEQLLREAGLDRPQASVSAPVMPPAPLPDPPPAEDVLVVAHAPGVAGSVATFVTLPTGDLIVESEQGDADLSPLADVVERNVAPPYRAVATRQNGDLWGVVATRLDVRRFSCDAGDEIEVVSRDGDVTVTVDGGPSDLRIPELEQDYGDYAVHASRIDGDYWEAEAHPL